MCKCSEEMDIDCKTVRQTTPNSVTCILDDDKIAVYRIWFFAFIWLISAVTLYPHHVLLSDVNVIISWEMCQPIDLHFLPSINGIRVEFICLVKYRDHTIWFSDSMSVGICFEIRCLYCMCSLVLHRVYPHGFEWTFTWLWLCKQSMCYISCNIIGNEAAKCLFQCQ